MRRILSALTLVVCLSGHLKADGLSELIANLKGLNTQEPVKVKIDLDNIEHENDEEKHEQRSLQLEDGPGGLRITQDSASGQAKKGKPGRVNISDKQKGENPWQRQVRANLELLGDLERAKLIEDRPGVLDGQTLRCLRVNLDLSLDDDAKKHVKHASHEASLWLGKDGLPIAMQRDLEIKVRALAFIRVSTKVSSWYRFTRVRDRLITTESRDTVEGEVMGHRFSGKEVINCTVLP
jgi:hypothetical protein